LVIGGRELLMVGARLLNGLKVFAESPIFAAL
jgi:hypothetical protein